MMVLWLGLAEMRGGVGATEKCIDERGCLFLLHRCKMHGMLHLLLEKKMMSHSTHHEAVLHLSGAVGVSEGVFIYPPIRTYYLVNHL
jgi:hypothetical protein